MFWAPRSLEDGAPLPSPWDSESGFCGNGVFNTLQGLGTSPGRRGRHGRRAGKGRSDPDITRMPAGAHAEMKEGPDGFFRSRVVGEEGGTWRPVAMLGRRIKKAGVTFSLLDRQGSRVCVCSLRLVPANEGEEEPCWGVRMACGAVAGLGAAPLLLVMLQTNVGLPVFSKTESPFFCAG